MCHASHFDICHTGLGLAFTISIYLHFGIKLVSPTHQYHHQHFTSTIFTSLFYSLSKISNMFSTKTLLLALGLAASSDAFFRMSCPGRTVRERLDPIVNPGAVSGHVHTISGGAAFKASMTYADTRASKCSSCTIKVRQSPSFGAT